MVIWSICDTYRGLLTIRLAERAPIPQAKSWNKSLFRDQRNRAALTSKIVSYSSRMFGCNPAICGRKYLMKRMARHSAPVSGLAVSVVAAAAPTLLPIPPPAADDRPFLPKSIVSPTVPENGDVNLYGLAIVPAGSPSGGTIAPGD